MGYLTFYVCVVFRWNSLTLLETRWYSLTLFGNHGNLLKYVERPRWDSRWNSLKLRALKLSKSKQSTMNINVFIALKLALNLVETRWNSDLNKIIAIIAFFIWFCNDSRVEARWNSVALIEACRDSLKLIETRWNSWGLVETRWNSSTLSFSCLALVVVMAMAVVLGIVVAVTMAMVRVMALPMVLVMAMAKATAKAMGMAIGMYTH